MDVQYHLIQELLRERADLHARLNLLPYDGTPCITVNILSCLAIIAL